jgi:hypothetical protein
MQTEAAGQESVEAGGLSKRTNVVPEAVSAACQATVLTLSIVTGVVIVAAVIEEKETVQNFRVPRVAPIEVPASPAKYIVLPIMSAEDEVSE